MKVKMIKDEDFVNYKKPSMFIGMPYCTFKCCKEAGIPLSVCQNYQWNNYPIKEVYNSELIKRYCENPITEAVVFGGLEPIESFDELLEFIDAFRHYSLDDIVIYTGFTEGEILEKIEKLSNYQNIIIKFGRYYQNNESHLDDVLGVKLASTNQYAKRIS